MKAARGLPFEADSSTTAQGVSPGAHGVDTEAPTPTDPHLSPADTPEFRQLVLRRVAQTDDLEAVAREFGLPSDVLFAWLKDAVDHGRRLGATSPVKPQPTQKLASAPPPAPEAPASMRAFVALMLVFGGSGVAFLAIGGSLGFVTSSHDFERVLEWVGAAVGLLLFGVLTRGLARDVAGDDSAARAFRLLSVVAVVGSLCAISVWMWTLALPSVAHRFARQPFEAASVVQAKAILQRKHGVCAQITTGVFDPRFPAQQFCVDRSQYSQVHVGQAIVLRGSASWFGFKRDSVVFVPVDSPRH